MSGRRSRSIRRLGVAEWRFVDYNEMRALIENTDRFSGIEDYFACDHFFVTWNEKSRNIIIQKNYWRGEGGEIYKKKRLHPMFGFSYHPLVK